MFLPMNVSFVWLCIFEKRKPKCGHSRMSCISVSSFPSSMLSFLTEKDGCVYVALQLCNNWPVFAKFGVIFMLVEGFPTSVFSLLYCFIGSVAVVQACELTELLETSRETMTWGQTRSKSYEPLPDLDEFTVMIQCRICTEDLISPPRDLHYDWTNWISFAWDEVHLNENFVLKRKFMGVVSCALWSQI
jgi:hypothetical protein